MDRLYTDNIRIEVLTRENAGSAFSLACKVFTEGSVLHTAVNISVEEYREYIWSSFEAMWQQGISLVAVEESTGDVVGCLIACDYTSQFQHSESIPNKLRPVAAILQNLENMYRVNRQFTAGEFMLIDMAVVTPVMARRGIYRKLREAAHQLGREAGFKWVVGELSSAATQHLCVNKLGHKVCAEIPYATFKYENKKPFATISTPPSIVLVEGRLN